MSVSVVIPAFNASAFVADAIQSVLDQTQRPDEILVIDDGSTDGTHERALKYANVRTIRLASNSGQAAALNRGVSESAGTEIAFLDADDVWVPQKLVWQLETLAAAPELDAVYGLTRERVTASAPIGAARDGRVLPAQLPSALLVRRKALLRVGPFDERFRVGSVVDWYSRALETGLRIGMVPKVVYERRIHGGNLGLTQTDRQADYLSVLRAGLARRRASPGAPGASHRGEPRT
jgi:glycosyltransferase involved in cell wall biosynthesis